METFIMYNLINHPIDIGLGLTSIILVSGLIFIYGRNYLHFKSQFSLGLLLFALLFFLQNSIFLISFVFVHDLCPAMAHYLINSIFFCEVVGLLILYMVTAR
jgi:hypothetical protein